MKPFKFQTTSSILSEVGSTAKIGEIMAGMGCKNVAFVTDAMILKLGLADSALEGLKKAGIAVHVFQDVVADPPEEMILKAVAEAKAAGIDGVVSVGGGSSMDTAKLIAVLCGQTDQSIDQMYGVGMVKGTRLPLVLSPTTAGTGSEVTPISIVTTGTNEKKGVVSPQLLPDWAVLDAELTVGLPAHITAATGIDAMVHAIEAFTTKHAKNILSDTLARQALELLDRRPEPRGTLKNAAGLHARRDVVCECSGGRCSRAGLPARGAFSRAARVVERAGPALRAGLQHGR